MDAELHGKNQDEVLEDVPEEILEPKGSCFETTDAHIKMENDGNSSLQNTSNLNQAIATGVHDINQLVKIENIDYSPCSENTDSIFENVFNLHGNQDTGLMSTKQERKFTKNGLENLHPYIEENSNIYIFENKVSDCENKDNGSQDTLVEIIKVKQEMKDTNLNIDKCVSGAETMVFKSYIIDSQTDPVDSGVVVNNTDDLQHNLLLHVQRPLCTRFNPGLQVQTVTQNDLCHPNNTVPQVNEHTSSDNCSRGISGKSTKQVNKKPDKRSKDFLLLKKDQPINTNGQPLTCVMCGKQVNTLNSLIEHICIIPRNTMNNERPYKCSLCQRDFKTFAHLKKHFELHHDVIKERTHLCYVCGNKFTSLSSLSKHILSHRKERPHQCKMCSKGFKTLIHLQSHMITHSTERPHQCNVCEKEFKTTSVLRMHMISHRTERPHQCHVCEKEFKTPSLLKMHRRWHSTERPHKCHVCDKEFMISKDLTRHMISHSTERPHQCTVCDKGFKYLDTLRHHMISHNSVWPHTCSKCDKGFKTAIALQNHMVGHTKGPHQHDGVDVNKQNQPSKSLSNHVISSSPERSHQCNVCDKGFKNSYVLKRHMLSHSNERPHKCNVCDKEFKKLTTLRQHMICHSSECPHLCGVCVKRFKIVEDLEKHMITHRTERSNQCNVCYKECKNLPALRYHRRTKHGKAKSVCEKTLNF